MNPGELHGIGNYLKATEGLPPLANAAGTRTSATYVATAGYSSAKIVVHLGAITGTPDSMTVDVSAKDATDASGTGTAAYKPDGVTAAALATKTAAGIYSFDVDLSNSRGFLGVTEVVAFVSGSSPKVPCGIQIILGGANVNPAV